MSDKQVEELRYPHSAQLFQFCKEALNIKHKHEVKVIDQHVGAILGFDPADSSHWKKGKKNIKSLQTVNAIAEHLEIDSRIITDMVNGKTDLEEALQEFKGYGPMQLSQKFYEELKREYFRDPARFALEGRTRSLDEVTSLNRQDIIAKTKQILEDAQVKTCPVHLPEVVETLPHVSIETGDVANDELVSLTMPSDGEWQIRVRPGEIRPHIRFLVAKAIGKVVLEPATALDTENELLEAKANIFANHLLMPGFLFTVAIRELDDTKDLVEQLSDLFWMSRSIVNNRLKDEFHYPS